LSLFATGVKDKDTGGKFAAGIVDTGGKFATGDFDAGGNFAAGVVDTGDKFATGDTVPLRQAQSIYPQFLNHFMITYKQLYCNILKQP
jgi:hypothetical protein